MNAYFVGLEWITAVGGENDSYVVNRPPKLILTLVFDGHCVVQRDIYYDVKQCTDRKITKNLRQLLADNFEKERFIIEDDEITNLSDILENIL